MFEVVKVTAPVALLTDVTPPTGVDQDKFPAPSVERYCPLAPLESGKIKLLLPVKVAAEIST